MLKKLIHKNTFIAINIFFSLRLPRPVAIQGPYVGVDRLEVGVRVVPVLRLHVGPIVGRDHVRHGGIEFSIVGVVLQSLGPDF